MNELLIKQNDMLLKQNEELLKENERLRNKVVDYIVKWAIEKDKNIQLKKDIENYIDTLGGWY